jgi:UDP-N-acetylglucosamine transferase subunit ALG13
VDSLSAQDLDVELASADVVIGHAGTGLALSSLAAGRRPVLLARDAARGEHVDDHQQQTHRTLEEAGLAVAAPADAPLTRAALLTAAGSSVQRTPRQMPVLLGD